MQGIASLPYEVVEKPMIPFTGIGSMPKQAEMLAEFGRNGDTYIVHAAEGETVIPIEVLNKNPRLKSMLWQQMAEMGIEPERYIVGNELNSINPVTGQPEFFLKKIFKGVKSVVKAALPVIGFAIGGAIAGPVGAGVGAGLGAKVSGQSWSDAAVTGVLAGVGASAGGMFPETEQVSLFDAPRKVLTDFSTGIRNLGKSGSERTLGGFFGGTTPVTPEGYTFTDTFGNVTNVPVADGVAQMGSNVPPTTSGLGGLGSDIRAVLDTPGKRLLATAAVPFVVKAATEKPPPLQDPPPTGVDYLRENPEKYGFDIARFTSPFDKTYTEGGSKLGKVGEKTGIMSMQPNIIGYDQYGNPIYGQPNQMQVVAADSGGEIVGPGTGTSDSIPAMLSDGEFVMTAKAVKNAGNGNRRAGAQKMYAMMKNLEKGAA